MRNGKLFPIVNDRFHSLKKNKLISEKDCFSRTKLMHHISTGNCCILKSVIQGFDLGQGMQYRLLIHQFYAGFSSTYFFIFVCPFNSISSTVKYVLEIALFRRSFIDSSLLRSCLYYVSSSAALCGGFFCSASQAAAQSVHSTSRPACVI